MFRFLTDRYPLIMQRLDEDHVFDHFYLDMNGIIHQCTHPNDAEIAIENTDEMFARIFHYTERLFRIVAPRSLMFLAVDGVAPRAKMNQQRSRRFRSAKDAERAMEEAIARGDPIPSGIPFDSNCITPGTQFMFDLSAQFRAWIHTKMSEDPAFQKGCTIVFSGPDVPGEGEHKIMDYIRSWKASENYSPNVRHCMYGLDADLMMLGLVVHAPHFTLLRERMRFTKNGRKIPEMRGTDSDADDFQLLEIAMLRDMLFLEFQRNTSDDPWSTAGRRSRRSPSRLEKKSMEATFANDPSSSSKNNSASAASPGFDYDSHRIVDDFVFMCMLVGNDFLPNLPHLDIAEGAINLMFRVYKSMLPSWGGYLTERHRLHPDRLQSFLAKISQSEGHYFDHRAYTDGVAEYKTPEYRRKYYMLKFKFDVEGVDGEKHLQRLRNIYMEGLHWVLQYYHNGVSSWNWYYPDFYAILASDMTSLRAVKVSFQKASPFRPLTQLMAVLPPESAQFLPAPMQDLMTNVVSPVVDFYPREFTVDQNGKRNTWEAVVIVPFIDEKRLLKEINSIDKEQELTKMEKLRDELGPEYWFYAEDYPKSDLTIVPVRPSKYVLPDIRRSRRPAPRGRGRGMGNYGARSRGQARSASRSNSSSVSRRLSSTGEEGGPEGRQLSGVEDESSLRMRRGSRGRGRGRGSGRGRRDMQARESGRDGGRDG